MRRDSGSVVEWCVKRRLGSRPVTLSQVSSAGQEISFSQLDWARRELTEIIKQFLTFLSPIYSVIYRYLSRRNRRICNFYKNYINSALRHILQRTQHLTLRKVEFSFKTNVVKFSHFSNNLQKTELVQSAWWNIKVQLAVSLSWCRR